MVDIVGLGLLGLVVVLTVVAVSLVLAPTSSRSTLDRARRSLLLSAPAGAVLVAADYAAESAQRQHYPHPDPVLRVVVTVLSLLAAQALLASVAFAVLCLVMWGRVRRARPQPR